MASVKVTVRGEREPLRAKERELTSSAPSLSRTRIAVLPFRNMGQDRVDDYIAEGMTEELIGSLSSFHELRVVARTSVARYRETTKSVSEIGKEINVGVVLEGSVRRSGNDIRVVVQLVDTLSEDHLWSERYDWKVDNVILAQIEIAEKVAAALKVKLLAAERERLQKLATESSEAYVSYLKGRSLLQRGRSEASLKEALSAFEGAVSQDPGYAKAYTGIADAYFLLGWYLFLPKDEALSKSGDALKTALRLDPDLAEAHASRGNLLLQDYRFEEAEAEFKRAIALNPGHALARSGYAACLGDTQRFEEALLQEKLLEESDPLSAVNSVNLSLLCSCLGMKDEASRLVQKIRRLDPGSPWADWGDAVASLWNSDFEKASSHLEKFLEKRPEDFERLAVLGYLYGREGKESEARAVLSRLEALRAGLPSGLAFCFAKVYCGLGERDPAFEWLGRALGERSLIFRWLSYLRMEELLEGDERYYALLRRAGLRRAPDRTEAPSLADGEESAAAAASWDLRQWAPRFAHPKSARAFDFLVSAFVQDEFINKLPVEKAGWRTLGEVSQKTGVAKSLLFGYPSGDGTVLKDLLGAKVAELKVFCGERGRGGEVTRIRIAYEKDDEIRRFIANQVRGILAAARVPQKDATAPGAHRPDSA